LGTADNPAQVAELLLMCMKRLQRLVDSGLSEHGLSLSRAKLLGELEHNGACHQAALAATFDLAPRTVTELVDSLERDGFVERRVDPTDRRARLVFITPSGQQARAHAVQIRSALIDQTFGTLGSPQLEALAATLRHLVERIDDASATAP
jgi:DNA-binding MarR family transcriptional regulator